LEGLWNALRTIDERHGRQQALLLGLLDSRFDVADRVEVLVDADAILRANLQAESLELRPDAVENAPIRADPFDARRLVVFLPEQPLEDDARVALHRIGHRRRLP